MLLCEAVGFLVGDFFGVQPVFCRRACGIHGVAFVRPGDFIGPSHLMIV